MVDGFLALGASFFLSPQHRLRKRVNSKEALWRLGGVVEVLRSDNLSAATHELPLSGGRALTKRYRALLEHYGLRSTRIFPRKAHENGVVEQAHRRTKSILAQMLVLRGSYDFPSVEEYQCWVREVIEREHNALLGEKLAEERRHLHALPAMALPAYTSMTVKVRRWSTIRVLNHTYSVPARSASGSEYCCVTTISRSTSQG